MKEREKAGAVFSSVIGCVWPGGLWAVEPLVFRRVPCESFADRAADRQSSAKSKRASKRKISKYI